MNALSVLCDHFNRERGSDARFQAAHIRGEMLGEDDGFGNDCKFATDLVLNSRVCPEC